MRAYSMDLREPVSADCQAGQSALAAARKDTASPARVRRLEPRPKATGSLAPTPPSPGRPVALAEHDARGRGSSKMTRMPPPPNSEPGWR